MAPKDTAKVEVEVLIALSKNDQGIPNPHLTSALAIPSALMVTQTQEKVAPQSVAREPIGVVFSLLYSTELLTTPAPMIVLNSLVVKPGVLHQRIDMGGIEVVHGALAVLTVHLLLQLLVQ